jgi:hypothetical protein
MPRPAGAYVFAFVAANEAGEAHETFLLFFLAGQVERFGPLVHVLWPVGIQLRCEIEMFQCFLVIPLGHIKRA